MKVILRTICCVAIIVLAGFAPIEKVRTTPLQIFSSARDFVRGVHSGTGIVSIDAPVFSWGKNLRVRYQGNKVEAVPLNSIWGYASREGIVFRFTGNGLLEIVAKENEIIVYKKSGRFTNTFFSIGFEGAVYNCTRKNLEAQAPHGSYSKELVSRYFSFF